MSRVRRLVLSDRLFFLSCRVLPTRQNLSESEFSILAQVMVERRKRRGFLSTARVFLPDHWHAIIYPSYHPTISRVLEAIKVGATNQINTAGFSYDQAGNLLSDGTHTYTWDAEGRLLTMDGGATADIVYHALGQMVQNLGNNTTYNAAGERTSGSGYEIVPWGSVPLVKYGTATLFVHGNVLGSSTDVTDQTGAERQDQIFYPWGQTWVLHQLPDDSVFAAMEPLTTTTGEETDIAQHRHYSESYGRWLSRDPAGGSLSDPQTLNKYAYVRNNSTTLTDPLGLRPVYTGSTCILDSINVP